MAVLPRSRSRVLRPQIDNTNGMVGWWPFDDGSAGDVSGFQNNGLPQGSPTPILGTVPGVGIPPGGLLLNGTSQFVETTKNNGNASAFVTFSIAIWFKSLAKTGVIILSMCGSQSGNSGQVDRSIYIDTTGKLIGYVFTTAAQSVATAGTVNDGRWHHAAISVTNHSGISLYLDGALVGTTTFTGSPFTGYSNSFWIMGHNVLTFSGPNSGTGFFNGSIDDARVYNRALSGAEINAIYLSAFQRGWQEAEMMVLRKPSFISAWARRNRVVEGIAS